MVVEDSSLLGTSPWTISSISISDVEEFNLSPQSNEAVRRRDSSDNLFEIVPHCFLQGFENSTPYNARRVLSTTAGNDTIGVVLDSELLILEKDSDLEKTRRVQFSSTIDFILWRRSVILAGLSSSEIVLVDPNTFEIKESRKVSPANQLGNEKFFIDAAIHSNPDPSKIDVIAVGVDGIVYSFSNISLSDGSLDSTHDQNVSVDIDVGSVRGTRIKCLESGSKVICAASPSRSILILGEVDGTLSMLDLEDAAGMKKELKISQSVNVKDFGWNDEHEALKKVVAFEGLLFVLLSNGRLEILLDEFLFPTTSFKLPDEADIVHDFILVMNNDSEIKLWVLFGKEDCSKNWVGIFGGLRFTLEFSVRIPSIISSYKDKQSSKLIFPTQLSPFEEPFAFIEISKSGTAVFRMVETSTVSTIQKLIARGKFDQAIALSIQYDKSLDIVFKAKARSKFNEMVSYFNNKKGDKADLAYEDMIQTLKNIEDSAFVCSFCSQKGVPKLEWIKQLLGVGKDRVKDCSHSDAGKFLLLNIKKFFTFEQVFQKGSIEDWLAFISEENTMFQQCSWFLNKHEFNKCERTWRRHFDEFIPQIKLSNFGPFFFVLFGQKLKSPDAVSLFKCILPFAVEKCADLECTEGLPSIDVDTTELTESHLVKVQSLVDIAKRQVCSLEREKQWPLEAIQFSNIVISIVKETIGSLEASRNRYEPKIVVQVLICKEILQRIQLIVQNLTELADLKQHHSIRIPFQDYFNNDVFEVVSSMLYELFHRSEIERFINSFLTPFAKRKGMEMDVLFNEHIKVVISDLPFHINPLDIPHEERLICLVSYISNLKIKLQSVRTIAEEWPVPWSPNIDSMVVASLRLNTHGDSECNDLLNTINIMRIQVPFRCLLNKYRLLEKKVQNYYGVTLALKRIIHVGKPEYYSDCLELIGHTKLVDENKLKSIEFSLKWKNLNLELTDFVTAKWDTGLLKRMLATALHQFKMGQLSMYSKEELSRITEVCRMLANILDDKKAVEFLKLREFVPLLQNPDIVYDEKYPYCVLTYIMSSSSEKSSAQLIKECKLLSDVTFTHFPDILIAAGSYFARPGGLKEELEKAWNIIEKVVLAPPTKSSRSSIVQRSALALSQLFICSCPDATDSRLLILQKFLNLLSSFEEIVDDVIKMLSSLQIFMALREQEIPLEKDFQKLYIWMFIEGIPQGPGDQFIKFLKNFGSTMLKFGDKSLFKQVFGMISKEFLSRIVAKTQDQQATRNFVKMIRELQKELFKSFDSLAEPETNKYVIDLVESLKIDADISVTPYALRQRNKSRFLEKLLSLNHYALAAQTAIVFEVFDDHHSWSKILQGFINAIDTKELKKVLMDLRNVSELWMLPEFASGWKMVAEVDSGFLDLCPIPLD